jgi:hypothetical protein
MGKTLAELWGDRAIDSFNSDECTIDEAQSFHSCEDFIDLFHCIDVPLEIQTELKRALQNMTRVDPTKRIGYKEMREVLQTLIERVKSSEFDQELAHKNCINQCYSDLSSDCSSEENSEDGSEEILFKFKTN